MAFLGKNRFNPMIFSRMVKAILKQDDLGAVLRGRDRATSASSVRGLSFE